MVCSGFKVFQRNLLSSPFFCPLRISQHVTSTDPLADPEINLNMFDYAIELDTMVEAFKWARKLKEHEPLRSIIVKEANPGIAVTSDEEIRGQMFC